MLLKHHGNVSKAGDAGEERSEVDVGRTRKKMSRQGRKYGRQWNSATVVDLPEDRARLRDVAEFLGMVSSTGEYWKHSEESLGIGLQRCPGRSTVTTRASLWPPPAR
jgi:hypothetical protein